jgi:hypothetical protein
MLPSTQCSNDSTFSVIHLRILRVTIVYLVPCCLYLCALTSPAHGQSGPEGPPAFRIQSTSATPLFAACNSFNELNTRIRDNRIARNFAKIELKRLLTEVRSEYYRAGGGDFARSAWVFPLEGYDARAISGGRRHGYIASGYDFYSGNRHGGHPSYDIFIRDRNRDSRDDRSGRPVKVRSLTGGVVVALEPEWEPGSRLRGGRYLWVYDPASELLVYYAHNGELSVKLGDLIKPGDLLGSVGRSGWNAANGRSPTHLHLTVVQVRDGKARPVAVYEDLRRAAVSALL